MAADAHAGGVDHGGSLARPDIGQGFFHGAHGIREVEAVAFDDLQVGVAAVVVADMFVGGLVPLGHGDGVAVVLDDEHYREPLPVGTVDALGTVALGE